MKKGQIDEAEGEFESALDEVIADVHELYDQGLKWLEDEDNCWLLFGTTFLMVLLPGKVDFCGVKISV